jgi:hypothetical protein
MTTTLAARAPHARLADGELGILAFGGLAVRTREGSPDQAAVNRALILGGNGRRRLLVGRRRVDRGFHSVEGLRQLSWL